MTYAGCGSIVICRRFQRTCTLWFEGTICMCSAGKQAKADQCTDLLKHSVAVEHTSSAGGLGWLLWCMEAEGYQTVGGAGDAV